MMDTGSYLAQPPLMLTTLEAADGFYDPLNYVPLTAEGAVPPSEPISSVRVRVAAADEPTATVQARIERVAADIAVATGLDVDVTPGSSPTAVAIELPPGDFGRPQLTMLEDWTRKGVSFDVIAGLDRRSFALAVMIQVVAGLFVANAAPAGVRSRRSEFATLCAVGWSARLVFVSVAAELGVIGVGAGLLGVVLAVGGLFAVGLPVDVGVTAAVVPLAIALAAGLAAARAAARIPPAAALRPPVRGPETVQPVRGLLGMAWRHVMRFAGRSVLGGVSLAISVAGLTALLAITLSYQELLIDSRLGLALADQVRPSDLAVAVLAVLFGAAAVAQVVFLNLREREVELAILRALGWTPRTVRRLSFLEGLLIALGGVLAGGAAGIGTAALDGGADALGPGLAAAGGCGGLRPGGECRVDGRGADVGDRRVRRQPSSGPRMNAPAPVRVAAITKTYRLAADVTITALDTMDLAVDAGEVLAVQGTSGSGKSTLLHLIGAMEPSDTGQIEVGRTVVTELDDRGRTVYRRSIGFVFQHLHLLPAPTLLDNVLAPVIPYQPDGDTTTRALGLLDAVVLADRASSTPGRLSGGQQQRVAIARALINSPRLILADEPTGALDETTGGVIVDLLLRVREQHDTSVIVATHDPSVAARCDRIVDLRDDGSVEQDG